MSPPNRIAVNGVDGTTGQYLSSATVAEIARRAKGETAAELHREDLQMRRRLAREREEEVPSLGVKFGVDPLDLTQAGWGVIFAEGDEHREAYREALAPLLELRRQECGDRYQELAVCQDETKHGFLARHGMGPGPADPAKVPYYLLIAADPEAIPFRFQYELAVQYAVGRVAFATTDELAHYAASVVAAEGGEARRRRRASFFGVANPGDEATKLSNLHLIEPLARGVQENNPTWESAIHPPEAATKAALGDLLSDPEGPAILFTASHGMGFQPADPRQEAHQGALLCADWPGPDGWSGSIPADFYFAGEDLGSQARVAGMIAFHFCCYGAGTPRLDDFDHLYGDPMATMAESPFVSALPQHLLAHPGGGALAAVGHVERAWTFSFFWDDGAEGQVTPFESALGSLMAGQRLGMAMEYLHQRYAELSTTLTETLNAASRGKTVPDLELADLWCANNDARSYIILGDPAVRLDTDS